MSTCTEFKCKSCDGTGLIPRFIAGGLVERPPVECNNCRGDGVVRRIVEDSDDRMLRGRQMSENFWRSKGRKALRTTLPDDLHKYFGLKIAKPRLMENGLVTMKSKPGRSRIGSKRMRLTDWLIDERGVRSRQKIGG